MAIGDDFSVAVNGDIRHVSGSTTYTVLELHRWLQDLADDQGAAGNDLVDITSDTPSERSTDNIITLLGNYNIDDDAAEYFYDGSITQQGGWIVYSGLVVVGSVASTTTLKIVQNNLFYDAQDAPFWGTNLNADAGANILMRCLVKTRLNDADIDQKRIRVQARTFGDTYAEFAVTLGLGNGTAAIFTNADLNSPGGGGSGTPTAATIDDWTEITNTEGYQLIDIDNDTTDEDYYSKWALSGTPTEGDGNINDLYQWGKALTRANHDDVVSIHGIDPELFRGITHSVAYTGASGDFLEDEIVTWGGVVTAGAGLVLAHKDDGATGILYMQLLSGVAPNANTMTGGTSTETATASTVTSRTVTPCFVGTSTGSNLIAAYGIGVDTNNISVGDQYFPLDDTGPILPPNVQSFTVSSLVNTEDQVLVGPAGTVLNYDQEGGTPPFVRGETLTFTSPAGTAVLADVIDQGSTGILVISLPVTGAAPVDDSTIAGGTSGATGFVNGDPVGTIDTRQLILNTTLNASGQVAVVCTTAIPSDTPSTGTIRVQLDTGLYRYIEYTSWSGSTFTTASTDWTDPADATADNNIFISYIDEAASGTSASYFAVYSANRSLWVRVRDGGGTPIKTFQTGATYAAAGGSVSAIRTSDA